MDYLIDTHILLWAIFQKEKIHQNVIAILEDSSNKIIVSQISIFEIVIKNKLGKLPDFPLVVADLLNTIKEIGFDVLPIKNEHFTKYEKFQFNENHKDPFDRLILATASYEKLILISNDRNFAFYKDTINVIN